MYHVLCTIKMHSRHYASFWRSVTLPDGAGTPDIMPPDLFAHGRRGLSFDPPMVVEADFDQIEGLTQPGCHEIVATKLVLGGSTSSPQPNIMIV